jgi:hypothetical protein
VTATPNAAKLFPRRYEPKSVTFHWATPAGGIAPEDLAQILEDVKSYSYDALPGSRIRTIAYDGWKLDITLREES